MSEWAGVKFQVTEKALYDPGDGRDPYCRFHPPGTHECKVGDVFTLTEEQAAGLRPETWIASGMVRVYSEPRRAREVAPIPAAEDSPNDGS